MVQENASVSVKEQEKKKDGTNKVSTEALSELIHMHLHVKLQWEQTTAFIWQISIATETRIREV